MVAAVIINLLIGAKINLIMLDILALIFVRPISAIASAKLLNELLGKIGLEALRRWSRAYLETPSVD